MPNVLCLQSILRWRVREYHYKKLVLFPFSKAVFYNNVDIGFTEAHSYFFSAFGGWLTDWPKDHNFQIFKLVIENIFLIDWFGGAKPLTVAEYLRYGMWVAWAIILLYLSKKIK